MLYIVYSLMGGGHLDTSSLIVRDCLENVVVNRKVNTNMPSYDILRIALCTCTKPNKQYIKSGDIIIFIFCVIVSGYNTFELIKLDL